MLAGRRLHPNPHPRGWPSKLPGQNGPGEKRGLDAERRASVLLCSVISP